MVLPSSVVGGEIDGRDDISGWWCPRRVVATSVGGGDSYNMWWCRCVVAILGGAIADGRLLCWWVVATLAGGTDFGGDSDVYRRWQRR